MSERVYDGFATLQNGMNGGLAPSLILPTQVASAVNFTFRDGFVKTRPPFANLPLSFISDEVEARFIGKFQGAIFYESDFGEDQFVISRGGRLFKLLLGSANVISEITPQLNIVTTADFVVPGMGMQVTVFVNSETVLLVGNQVKIDSGTYTIDNRATDEILVTYNGGAANATAVSGTPITNSADQQFLEYEVNPSFFELVYMFTAENYVIVMGGQHSTIIYDGNKARLAGIGELPPGQFGLYAWGRCWITLPDRRSFIAGDLVYGPSGTPENGYRDAILKVTENDFLNEGGSFAVPKNAGPITTMNALATQDTSLGIGPILVGCTNMICSVNAPVDRTTWKNLTYPIQTVSLLEHGPQGPRNTFSVNGDEWYRYEGGSASFIVARRDMNVWGNTPMSREVSPILSGDSEDLLLYGSGIYFDNKMFMTVSPFRTDNGIAHEGLVVINFDLLSSLAGKLPPAWEGVYTGLDILQVLKGRTNERDRGFAFVLNGNAIELWELLKSGYYDAFTEITEEGTNITRTAIQPWLETRSMDFQDASRLKKLHTGELFLDELVDTVNITIKFRPDQYPTWTTWATISICSNVTQCTITAPTGFDCSVWKSRANQYAARIMLPMPSEGCNQLSGRPVSWGYEFQFRIEGTGHFRIRRFRPHAIPQTDNMQGECPAEAQCKTIEDCGTSFFNYSSHGT